MRQILLVTQHHQVRIPRSLVQECISNIEQLFFRWLEVQPNTRSVLVETPFAMMPLYHELIIDLKVKFWVQGMHKSSSVP